MSHKIKEFFTGGWFLTIIVILQFAVLYFSPNEQTLGSGIKPVYLHVSLTWAGMIFLSISALLGILALFLGRDHLAMWHRSFLSTALLIYGVGFFISLFASWVNWGGIPFQEPRIRNAINVVVIGIVVWTMQEMFNNERIQGASGIFPFIFILFVRGSDRMVLHPDNPVNSAPWGIKLTFFLMFSLALLLSIWLLFNIDRKRLRSKLRVD
jgi:hypothetical protein